MKVTSPRFQDLKKETIVDQLAARRDNVDERAHEARAAQALLVHRLQEGVNYPTPTLSLSLILA